MRASVTRDACTRRAPGLVSILVALGQELKEMLVSPLPPVSIVLERVVLACVG